jgi:hypothetical protein
MDDNNQIQVGSFDEIGATTAGCANDIGLAGADSMEVSNDPRFFSDNVMDKRLGAFKALTLVSSLMFGTSLGQVFHLKKDQNFSEYDALVGSIAFWQLGSFIIALSVSMMCLLSLYIIAHQLFYTYRLMTAGPTGFEQACVFYLTRVVTMWRHVAIKCLFHGLLLFMVLIGTQLFVAFYKDAKAAMKEPDIGWLANLNGTGTSIGDTAFNMKDFLEKHPTKHKLSMKVHSFLGYLCLFACTMATFLLIVIRRHHLVVFQENYRALKGLTVPLEATMRAMSHRGSAFLDT